MQGSRVFTQAAEIPGQSTGESRSDLRREYEEQGDREPSPCVRENLPRVSCTAFRNIAVKTASFLGNLHRPEKCGIGNRLFLHG